MKNLKLHGRKPFNVSRKKRKEYEESKRRRRYGEVRGMLLMGAVIKDNRKEW